MECNWFVVTDDISKTTMLELELSGDKETALLQTQRGKFTFVPVIITRFFPLILEKVMKKVYIYHIYI